MNKLLIPAFACTAAMFTACGDDSSSASSESAESSSSVAAESSSSDWAHEGVGNYTCFSAKDSTTFLKYSYEGPDNAMEVAGYVYPKLGEDVEKVCEEAKANKTDGQEVTCEKHVTISNPLKTMTFDSFKALMTEECKEGSIMNDIDMTNPDVAPENVYGEPNHDLDHYSIAWCIYETDLASCDRLCGLNPELKGCVLRNVLKKQPNF